MSVDSLDFNHDSIAEIGAYLFSRFEKADRNAGRLLISALRHDFPVWVQQVGANRDIAFKDAVEAFISHLSHRLQTSPSHSLKVDYQVVQKIDFLLGDYVGVYCSAIQSMRAGLDGWLLEDIPENKVDELDELVLKLRGQITSVDRLISSLDSGLSRKQVSLVNYPRLSWLWNLFRFSFSVLDLACLRDLEKEQNGLERDVAITRQWRDNFRKLKGVGERSLQKFQEKPYQIFQALEQGHRDLLTRVYFYTRIENANQSEKLIPSDKLDAILREKLPFAEALRSFEAYHQALDQALYEESRILKEMAAKGELDTESGRQTVEMWLDARRTETHKLKVMIWRVREFLLRTDPDPYVHTRMGWHDRPIGPEPKQTQPLQYLSRALRRLDRLFHRLAEAVHEFERADFEDQQKNNVQLAGQLFALIRELGLQHTEEEARAVAEELLRKWGKLDEVCSFNKRDVALEEVLVRKALIYDTFQVLQNKRAFHEIYRQHIAIRCPFADEAQRQRLIKLSALVTATGSLQREEGFQLAKHFLESIEEGVANPMEREDRKKQLLEFLFVYGQFTGRLGQILPRGVDAQRRAIHAKIQDLDGLFYEEEQEVMLGFHTLEPFSNPQEAGLESSDI